MAEKTKFWYLKHFNILESVDKKTMMKLNDMTTMSTVKASQPIYFPDEQSSSIFFLKEGRVKISRISPEGQEVILDIIGPGELFGEIGLVDPKSDRDEIAQAMDDVLICTMRVKDFESMMRENSDLNLRVTKWMGLRLRKFEERIPDLMFKDVNRRVVGFLVKYAEEFGRIKDGFVTIRPALSHQDIGYLTGCARQTVTTVLNKLRNDDILDFDRKHFLIKNYHKLKMLDK
jgi:CRP/FNR family transcriptional regulator, cyclic AMP receptor protein